MRLALYCATMDGEPYHPGDIDTWVNGLADKASPVAIQLNTADNNLSVVGSYEHLYRRPIDAEILAFLHDDVICREANWDERVLKEFNDPTVGIVGFGGALQHGDSNIYKTPYRLQQLGRSGYLSNVDDAEVHGQRFTGSCDVAVLDGFALIVRRELLDKIGGFKILMDGKIDFIGYDYMLCGLAHRLGYRVRLIGVRCHHKGGGTSVGMKVDRQAEYDYSHRWIYDNLRDVLPWRCG